MAELDGRRTIYVKIVGRVDGSLVFTAANVLSGAAESRNGEMFTLSTRIGGPEGEPVTPECHQIAW